MYLFGAAGSPIRHKSWVLSVGPVVERQILGGDATQSARTVQPDFVRSRWRQEVVRYRVGCQRNIAMKCTAHLVTSNNIYTNTLIHSLHDPQSSDRRQTWTYFCRDQDLNSASEPLALQPPKPGTLSHLTSVRPATLKLSNVDWKHFYFVNHIAYLSPLHSWQTDILLDFIYCMYFNSCILIA